MAEQSIYRRRRVRRKRRPRFCDTILIIFLLVVILTLVSTGIAAYCLQNSRQLPGVYTTKIDMTEQVIERINRYLDDASLGNETDARDYVEKVEYKLTLTLGADHSYREELKEEDYEKALSDAEGALKKALKSLAAERLQMVSLEAPDDVEALLQDAVGMNFDDYLKQYGPELLPDREELSAEYSARGSYMADREKMTVTWEDGRVTEYGYLVSDRMLVLLSDTEEYVYTREAE